LSFGFAKGRERRVGDMKRGREEKMGRGIPEPPPSTRPSPGLAGSRERDQI
jgi:hypothetical protein